MNRARSRFILVSPKNRTAHNFRGELLERIASYGYETIVTGPNRTDVAKIEALGARFCEIALDKDRISATADLVYLYRLWRLFVREHPEVVLGYTVKPVIYGAIAAKAARVPHIVVMVTGAGYAFASTSRKARVLRFLIKTLYRIAFTCADTVIFQNQDDRDEFVSSGLVPARKTRLVNGSGVAMDKFPLAPHPEQLTFFMLARVLRSKGVAEYLEAARKVRREFPAVRFMYLGATENQPDSLGHDYLGPFIDEGTVEYFPETDDVVSYFAQCSVFVLPSYREGTPRTVLEAMSMGRPVVTTDAPGCRQTVVDGRNGFLVPPRDVEALVDRMSWFARHPEAVVPMGRESRTLCAEKFDVVTVNDEMMRHLGMVSLH